MRLFSNNFSYQANARQNPLVFTTVKSTNHGISDTTFSKHHKSPFIGNATCSLDHHRLPKAFCWPLANGLSVTPGWSKILGK